MSNNKREPPWTQGTQEHWEERPARSEDCNRALNPFFALPRTCSDWKRVFEFLSDPGPIIVYPSQWLTDWLTDSLTHCQTCWRFNELTFADGIKYLSDVDIEISQQLKTSGKACKAGNSCNSCQSWRQWIDLCWWNQISKRCWHWN